jgi:hypothetical protein
MPQPRLRSLLIAGTQLLAVAVGAAVLLVRQAGHPSWNTTFGEDTSVFLPRAFLHPWSSLIQPWAGYIQLVPQLIADVVTRLPLRDAAAGLAVAGCIVASGCAMLVYKASAGHIRSRALRCALAASVVLLPLAPLEVAANAVDTPWYLIFAAFWALLWRPSSRTGLAAAALVCFGAMSSQFVAVLLAPLVVARVIALPRLREQAPAFGWLAGLAVQVPALLRQRPAQLRGSPMPALGFYADHVLTTVLAGWRLSRGLAVAVGGAEAALIAAVVVAAVGTWAFVKGDGRIRMFIAAAVLFGLAAAVIPGTSRLWVVYLPSTAVWMPGSRYTVVPVLLLVSAAIAAVDACLRRAETHRATGTHAIAVFLLVVVLGTGWVADFRYYTSRSGYQTWSQVASSFDQGCRLRPSSVYIPALRVSLPCSLA